MTFVCRAQTARDSWEHKTRTKYHHRNLYKPSALSNIMDYSDRQVVRRCGSAVCRRIPTQSKPSECESPRALLQIKLFQVWRGFSLYKWWVVISSNWLCTAKRHFFTWEKERQPSSQMSYRVNVERKHPSFLKQLARYMTAAVLREGLVFREETAS